MSCSQVAGITGSNPTGYIMETLIFYTAATFVGLAAILVWLWLCVRYIPNNRIGIIEKLWSKNGSLSEGNIVALRGEAGFEPEVLRGGFHFGYWRWQYNVHQRTL